MEASGKDVADPFTAKGKCELSGLRGRNEFSNATEYSGRGYRTVDHVPAQGLTEKLYKSGGRWVAELEPLSEDQTKLKENIEGLISDFKRCIVENETRKIENERLKADNVRLHKKNKKLEGDKENLQAHIQNIETEQQNLRASPQLVGAYNEELLSGYSDFGKQDWSLRGNYGHQLVSWFPNEFTPSFGESWSLAVPNGWLQSYTKSTLRHDGSDYSSGLPY